MYTIINKLLVVGTRMLEQSKQNGAVYYSSEKQENGKSKLVTKSVVINQVKFGPPHPITIHRNIRTSSILVEYNKEPDKNGYIYQDTFLTNRIPSITNPDDELLSYLYGIAEIDNEYVPYFIQNTPKVTLSVTPDRNKFDLPPTLTGYPYDQLFTYDASLLTLLADVRATYTDKYKRPIHPIYIERERYFPVDIDTIQTTVKDIIKTPKTFPIVVSLAHVDIACIDLEPGYTKEDEALAYSFDAYYVEDTPRGGKHLLVKNDEKVYKYSVSKHLEIVVNTLVTLYGINSKWLKNNPDNVYFDTYTEVGNNPSIPMTSTQPDGIHELANEVENAIERIGSTGKRRAKRAYTTSNDDSWSDFTALARLYRFDIEPFKDSIPKDALPWVLAQYGSTVIPSRLKHQTERNGLPYLVYLAHKIIKQEH